jgi:hypothetical protein
MNRLLGSSVLVASLPQTGLPVVAVTLLDVEGRPASLMIVPSIEGEGQGTVRAIHNIEPHDLSSFIHCARRTEMVASTSQEEQSTD